MDSSKAYLSLYICKNIQARFLTFLIESTVLILFGQNEIKRYLHSIFSIHFPSKIPINILRVLLHAPFSFVDEITWVILESHFFRIVTPDNLSKSETVSCSFNH
jgi:hypothetical protein